MNNSTQNSNSPRTDLVDRLNALSGCLVFAIGAVGTAHTAFSHFFSLPYMPFSLACIEVAATLALVFFSEMIYLRIQALNFVVLAIRSAAKHARVFRDPIAEIPDWRLTILVISSLATATGTAFREAWGDVLDFLCGEILVPIYIIALAILIGVAWYASIEATRLRAHEVSVMVESSEKSLLGNRSRTVQVAASDILDYYGL